ncbi:hypothetical protein Btru_029634 [Bulinus truncatus]|nr:hypothetical protein Btru_029634 [Bulinus truncatus]
MPNPNEKRTRCKERTVVIPRAATRWHWGRELGQQGAANGFRQTQLTTVHKSRSRITGSFSSIITGPYSSGSFNSNITGPYSSESFSSNITGPYSSGSFSSMDHTALDHSVQTSLDHTALDHSVQWTIQLWIRLVTRKHLLTAPSSNPKTPENVSV